MYPSCKFCTRLPIEVIPHEHNFEELFQRDLEKKMQMKGYAYNKRYVKPDIQVGDSGRVPFDQKFWFEFLKFSYVEWNGTFHQAGPISFFSRLSSFPTKNYSKC